MRHEQIIQRLSNIASCHRLTGAADPLRKKKNGLKPFSFYFLLFPFYFLTHLPSSLFAFCLEKVRQRAEDRDFVLPAGLRRVLSPVDRHSKPLVLVRRSL